MRCETTTKSTAREVLQTSASCGRSFHLQTSKCTGFCVTKVVPSVGLGSTYSGIPLCVLKVLQSYLV